tara:strand:- start:87 stop:476 length:390 start_codon:yes stop_codon:yes gene_type:complete
VLLGLCKRSVNAQTEQHSGGPASLLAIVPGIVICGGQVTLPAILNMRRTYKSVGHGCTVWFAVSRAAESEREEGIDLVFYLPLVPRCGLAISISVLSLSLPPLLCIATLVLAGPLVHWGHRIALILSCE